MSGTIKVTSSAIIDNGSYHSTIPQLIQTITQAAQGGDDFTVLIPTSDTAIDLSRITTLGWVWLQNLDATNYVSYGPTSAGAIVPVGRLNPGERHELRLEPGISLRAQAHTASVKLQVSVLEA